MKTFPRLAFWTRAILGAALVAAMAGCATDNNGDLEGGRILGNSGNGYFWRIYSPSHGQTFSYGTETDRKWANWNGHLALLLTYTNDPFVDRQNPRVWDNFRFDFPNVRLGADGKTFYYTTPHGRQVPVAEIRSEFLGNEVRLLPNASVYVIKPSGTITVHIDVFKDPGAVAQSAGQ
ncbi:MAG: hypothetical protein WDO13_03115 [Verrucomicrobiota bacterium]